MTPTAATVVTTFDGQYFSGTAQNTSYIELLDIARRMISPADTHFQTPSGVLDSTQNAYTEGAQWVSQSSPGD